MTSRLTGMWGFGASYRSKVIEEESGTLSTRSHSIIAFRFSKMVVERCFRSLSISDIQFSDLLSQILAVNSS